MLAITGRIGEILIQEQMPLAGINAVAQRIGAFLEVLGFTVEYLETDGAPVHCLLGSSSPVAMILFRAYGYGVQSRYSGGSPIQG